MSGGRRDDVSDVNKSATSHDGRSEFTAVAVVRATDAAGNSAQEASVPVPVDFEVPSLAGLSVEGFEVGGAEACALNRSTSLAASGFRKQRRHAKQHRGESPKRRRASCGGTDPVR